jgi:hypothetical protein
MLSVVTCGRYLSNMSLHLDVEEVDDRRNPTQLPLVLNTHGQRGALASHEICG